MRRIETKLVAAGLLAAGLVLGTVAVAAASSNAKLSETLAATGGASGAAGKASLKLQKKPGKATKGTFAVKAKHLVGNDNYDLIVGGVKVGTITTNGGGTGQDSFSTTPGRTNSLLGFDPRGSTVLLRDSTGTDVLVGTIPDDSPDSGACCLSTMDDEGETECEDLLPADCTAAGGTTPMITNPDGTQTPATSCLPDPCNPTSTPPGGVAIACCINTTHDEGTETECEDYTETACATAGGVVVQVPGVTPSDGNPCDSNPCQPAAPPATTPSSCCVPHTGSNGVAEPPECEDLSADACTAIGAPPTSGSCNYIDASGTAASVPCP